MLDRILAQCDRTTNVMIVTHGTPARHIIEYLTGVLSDDLIKTGEYMEIPWDKAYSSKNAPGNAVNRPVKPEQDLFRYVAGRGVLRPRTVRRTGL